MNTIFFGLSLFTKRNATIDDGSLIVEFIKAMASYEGMADMITATDNL